jgi:hypothetical protein
LFIVVYTFSVHQFLRGVKRELLLVLRLNLLVDNLASVVVFVGIDRLFILRAVDHVVLVFASLQFPPPNAFIVSSSNSESSWFSIKDHPTAGSGH